MDKKTLETGERTGVEEDQPGSGGADEIEASGDAIIISDAIHQLAESFRDVAAAIRQATAQPSEEDDDDADKSVERYLDGSPIKK